MVRIISKTNNIFINFSGPKGIAVNRSGHLVVVDNKASCVMVFQPNGKLVQRFGSRGNPSDPGKFAGPHFVAINSQDHIIVSDFHNHSIKVIYLISTWDLPKNLFFNLLTTTKIAKKRQKRPTTVFELSFRGIGKLVRRAI